MNLPANESLGLGLIGCGDYAQNHLKALARTEGLHLAAAYDLDGTKAAATCQRYGGRPAASRAELLARPEVAAVIVSTPNRLHCEDALAAFAAGKHVFINIPVTHSVEEARSMIAAARAADRVLMAGANHRNNPAVRALQATLAAGTLGPAHLMQACVGFPTAYRLAPGNWRRQSLEAPLLPFSQMGVIGLEIALMLWGPPARVSAGITKRDGPTETPDLGAVYATYADGRVFAMTCSYVTFDSYWLTVSGPRGSATWDRVDANSLRVATPAGIERQPYVSPDEQRDELLELRACIREHREPAAGAESIYHLAEFYRVIAASITSGRTEAFEPWSG